MMEPNYGDMALANVAQRLAVGGETCERAETPLDRIGPLASEINACANRIEKFIARFHGGANSKEATSGTPAASGHAAALGRLVEAVKRLDNLTNALSSIG